MFYIKKFFKFDSRSATFKKEIIGGLSTFLAMAYILAVNPSLVGNSTIDPNLPTIGDNGNIINTAAQYNGGLFLATAIASFMGTFLMGLWGNLPVGLAPGMGLNAFFAFNVSSSIGFESALTVTMISGILYFIIVLSPARDYIVRKVPKNLKLAIGAALGFFLAYLGLQNSGIVQTDVALVSKLGDFGNPIILFSFILLFVGLALYYLKIPGSIMITMLIGALFVIIFKFSGVEGFVDANVWKDDPYEGFSSFGTVVASGWLGFANVEMWKSPITYFGILCFLYMDFFDTTGTLIALDRSLDLEEKDPKWMQKANFVDAVSTFTGSAIGATTVTSYVESNVGVSAGAKTGFSNLVIAACFAIAIPAYPLFQVFMPIMQLQPITGPILVIIGTILITQLKYFEWEIAIDIPSLFMTIIFMMLTNSIALGIGIGIITFVFLNFCAGMYQMLVNRKKVIETMTIPMADDVKKVKSREFRYLKRLNPALIFTALISIIYIIIFVMQ